MDVDGLPAWVAGHAVRTSNGAEADPGRAQLPGLWQRATSDPALRELAARGTAGYVAVLTDYESDETGGYAQVVGVGIEDAGLAPAGVVAVRVPDLPFARYPFSGPVPQALIATWQQIWADASEGRLDRAFATDVEVHRPDGSGEVLVSINPTPA